MRISDRGFLLVSASLYSVTLVVAGASSVLCALDVAGVALWAGENLPRIAEGFAAVVTAASVIVNFLPPGKARSALLWLSLNGGRFRTAIALFSALLSKSGADDVDEVEVGEAATAFDGGVVVPVKLHPRTIVRPVSSLPKDVASINLQPKP